MSEVQFESGGEGMAIDLTDVKEDGFEVLPKGTYNVIVEEAEAKRSSSGNAMFSLRLEVEDGEYAGRKLFTHVVFSPKTLGQAKRTLSRLGVGELLSGQFNPLDQANADKLVGKRAKVKVDIEKYEGEDTNRVKQVLPAGGGGDGF